MRGIVNVPVVTTLADVLPLTVPIKPLEITATLAGPPLDFPAIAAAKSLKKAEHPVILRNAPKRTNRKIYVAETPRICPKSLPLSNTFVQ